MTRQILIMVLAPEVIPRDQLARTIIATVEQEMVALGEEPIDAKLMFLSGSPVYTLLDNGMLRREE